MGPFTPPNDVNVVLFVPNSPGHLVREKFLEGSGIYGAMAVDQDVTGDAMEIVLAIAKAVGSTRVGVVEVDFSSETEGDNFEEQVLYGGTIALMRAVFEIMVAHGYPPHFAYAKAIRSLRSVVDVMDEVGIEGYISERSSRTCEFAVRIDRSARHQPRRDRENLGRDRAGRFCCTLDAEWQIGHVPSLPHAPHRCQIRRWKVEGKEWRELFGAAKINRNCIFAATSESEEFS